MGKWASQLGSGSWTGSWESYPNWKSPALDPLNLTQQGLQAIISNPGSTSCMGLEFSWVNLASMERWIKACFMRCNFFWVGNFFFIWIHNEISGLEFSKIELRSNQVDSLILTWLINESISGHPHNLYKLIFLPLKKTKTIKSKTKLKLIPNCKDITLVV
jgi:hypothetical protein